MVVQSNFIYQVPDMFIKMKCKEQVSPNCIPILNVL